MQQPHYWRVIQRLIALSSYQAQPIKFDIIALRISFLCYFTKLAEQNGPSHLNEEYINIEAQIIFILRHYKKVLIAVIEHEKQNPTVARESSNYSLQELEDRCNQFDVNMDLIQDSYRTCLHMGARKTGTDLPGEISQKVSSISSVCGEQITNLIFESFAGVIRIFRDHEAWGR